MALRRVPSRAASAAGGGGLLRRLRALLGGRRPMSPSAATELRARRDALAARLQAERRAFAERGRIYREHPMGQTAFGLPDVERKLANLFRIRVGRVEAELAACQRELAALEEVPGPEP
ncbi:MAG: hypothetical protein HYY54_07540 [candidate division NC10 bacterium]|nr:hypothetical protein [candidate division NC10 bacterium]MBI4390448.1 hypothetical protein [candidate division NC10 bacterium]